MYRLMYKDPTMNAWIKVSERKSLEEIKEIWDSIFWSEVQNRPMEYGGIEKFLRIDNLTTGEQK